MRTITVCRCCCNLVSYSRERGIRVIAEGVECQEEMEVLIENGVDYLQGFYLGRPADQPGPLPEDIVGSIRAAAARPYRTIRKGRR